MKNLVSLNLEQTKEFLLVIHIEVKDTNVIIRYFENFLNAFM